MNRNITLSNTAPNHNFNTIMSFYNHKDYDITPRRDSNIKVYRFTISARIYFK